MTARTGVTFPPHHGAGGVPLPAGKSLKNCVFRYWETADFDCHRVEGEPVGGRQLHHLKSSGFHGALLRQLSNQVCSGG